MTLKSVVVVQQSPDWGGAEAWMLEVVRALSSDGTQVTTYTDLPVLRQEFKRVGASSHVLPVHLDIIGNWKGLLKTLIALPYAIWFYLKLSLRHREADLILMSGFSEKMLCTLTSRIFGLPVVWYEYGELSPVFQKNLGLPRLSYRYISKIPKAILTLSDHTQRIMQKQYQIEMKVVSPWVLPGKTIKTKPSTPGVAFGCLSRVAKEKGQRALIEAFASLVPLHPNWTLTIAGSGPDTPWLKTYIHTKKLANHVKLLGFVDDPYVFYQSLDVFVMPSTWKLEGFGLVLIEAMAAGLPVICFDKPPMNEIVTSKVGITVSPPTSQHLARAMKRLGSEKGLRQRLSASAQKHASTKYGFDRQFNKLKEVLWQASRS